MCGKDEAQWILDANLRLLALKLLVFRGSGRGLIRFRNDTICLMSLI